MIDRFSPNKPYYFSKDKLAYIRAGFGCYEVHLIRDGNAISFIMDAGELISTVNSTLDIYGDPAESSKAFNRDNSIRVSFGISLKEAERLKESYVEMKTRSGYEEADL